VPLIMGSPASPPQIVRSLLRDPLTTLPVLRFGARTLRAAGKLLESGDTKGSIERFVRGCLGDDAFAALPEDPRAHARERLDARRAVPRRRRLRADHSRRDPVDHDAGAGPRRREQPRNVQRLCGVVARLLPNSQPLDVPNASHLMHLENPDAVHACLLRFLGEVTRQDQLRR